MEPKVEVVEKPSKTPVEPEPQVEPEKVEAPKEEVKAEPQVEVPKPEKATVWTMESLSDSLPMGTISVENTEDGLVLVFNSRFLYQNAYRNLSDVKEKIHQKTASEINIVLSYSEPPQSQNPEPAAEKTVQSDPAPQQEKTQEPVQAQAPSLSEEQKNLITDLMLCFDGREER